MKRFIELGSPPPRPHHGVPVQTPRHSVDFWGHLANKVRWAELQGDAAAGSISYGVYYGSRAAYHAASHMVGGAGAQPLLALLERAGLRGDMAMDKAEHELGNPRGRYDEGRQKVGTFPITHWGPKLNLPGARPSGKKDLDPLDWWH
jgi:hypothetical protein